MPTLRINDLELLEAALAGYQHTIEQIEERIAELRGKSGGNRGESSEKSEGRSGPRTKRVRTAASRKRMAEAQRKRWAAFKAKQTAKS